MFGKRFLVTALVGLLVIALLVGGMSAMQRNAWSQGYMMGRLSTGSDGGAVTPYVPYGYPGSAYLGGAPFGGGLGLIFLLGLLFVLFLAIGRSFRHRAWAMHGGPDGGPDGMSDHPWKHMGPPAGGQGAQQWHRPPWCWGQENDSQAQPGKAGAEANGEADTTEAAQ